MQTKVINIIVMFSRFNSYNNKKLIFQMSVSKQQWKDQENKKINTFND